MMTEIALHTNFLMKSKSSITTIFTDLGGVLPTMGGTEATAEKLST